MKQTLPLLALLCLNFSQMKAQNWLPVLVGEIINEYVFTSISVVDENVAWAAASYWDVPPVPEDHVIKIFRTTDGGQAWKVNDQIWATGAYLLKVRTADGVAVRKVVKR